MSAELDVDSYGIVNFYINCKGVKTNLKMNVCSIEEYSYICFLPLLEKEIPYRIKNNIKEVEAKATMIDGSILYGQEVAFLWKDPSVKHIFELKLKAKKGGDSQIFEINPDEVSVSTRRAMKIDDRTIQVKIHIDMK